MKHVELPDLSGYGQPPWNDAESVSRAFEAVLDAHDEASSWAAYHTLLFALGNDHAGTYCTVIIPALPAMASVLRGGGPWAKHTILQALTDLACSFEPELGNERYNGADLKGVVDAGIAELRPIAQRLAHDAGFVGNAARELLDTLDELSAPGEE